MIKINQFSLPRVALHINNMTPQKLRKGMYVKSMSGISPVGFGNRIGKVVSVYNVGGSREAVVIILDKPGRQTKMYMDDTLEIISNKKAIELIKERNK